MESVEEYFVLLVIFVLSVLIYRKFFEHRPWKLCNLGVNAIIKDNENYIRLLTCFNFAGRKACLEVIFNNGLSRNKRQLYQDLSLFKTDFNNLKSKKIINQKQFDLLYPSAQETDYDEFDITLLYQIIRNCSTLQQPIGGWKIKTPKTNDRSVAAYVICLKDFRNKLSHYGDTKISDVDFKILWDELMTILTGLNYKANNLKDLQYCPLDTTYEYKNAILKAQMDLCYDQLLMYGGIKVEVSGLVESNKCLARRYDNMSQENKKMKQQFQLNVNHIAEETWQLKAALDEMKEVENAKLMRIYKRICTLKSQFVLRADTLEEKMNARISDDSTKYEEDQQPCVTDLMLLHPIGFNGVAGKFKKSIEINSSLSDALVNQLTKMISTSPTFLLDGLRLNDSTTDAQLKTLSHMTPYLSRLTILCNRQLSQAGWQSFSNIVHNSDTSRLQDLTILSCSLNDVSVCAIAKIAPKLRWLDLSYNKGISPIGTKAMNNAMAKASPFFLKSLRLSECNLTDAHVTSLSQSIIRVERVFLSGNKRLTMTALTHLKHAIKDAQHVAVKEIDTRDCKLQSLNLSKMLQTITVDGMVDDADNFINGLTEFVAEKGNVIVFLKVRNYNVTLENVEKLCKIFLRSKTIYFEDVQITTEAFVVIANMFTMAVSFDTVFINSWRDEYDESMLTYVINLNNLQNLRVRLNIQLKADSLSILQKVISDTKKNQLEHLSLTRWGMNDVHLQDLADNIHLIKSLDLSDNPYITPMGIKHLAKGLSGGLMLLESLYLNECGITEEHLFELSHVVPYLKHLSLRRNYQITASAIKGLSTQVTNANFYRLKSLDLSDCNLTDSHMQALKHLFPLTKSIHLDKNKMITSAGWKYFSESIRSSSMVIMRSLSLQDTSIEDTSLSSVMEGAKKIYSLDISRNKMLEPLKSFSMHRTLHCSLKEIKLNDCNLKNAALVKICKEIPSLKDIYADGNPFSVECFKNFTQFITTSYQFYLDSISFVDCNLNDKHLQEISSALLLIRRVNLSENKRFTSTGLTCLSNAIGTTSRLLLQDLVINNCDLSLSHMVGMESIIESVRSLCLQNNHTLTTEALAHIAFIITNSNRLNLEKINFGGCSLTDHHIQAFSSAVPYLKHIDLSSNKKMTPVGLHCIASSTCLNTSKLEMIQLDDCDLNNSDMKVFYQQISSIKSLSVSKNGLLTHEAVSYKPNISNIWRVDMIDISRFSLKDNSITYLSPIIPLIERLNLSSQKEISSSGFTAMTKSIMECRIKKIRFLSLVACNLIDDDVVALSRLLPYLQQIDISCNKTITPSGYGSMSDALCNSSWCYMEKVLMKDCHITDQHMYKLGGIISCVKYLDISDNKCISEKGWKSFSDAITKADHFNLNTLVLRNCNMNTSHLRVLKDVIPLMSELSIDCNFTLTSVDLEYLSNAISAADHSNLTSLTLTTLNFQDGAMQSLARMIPLLRVFNPQGSEVSTLLTHVSSVVKRSRYCQLDLLDLSCCNLQEECLLQICHILHFFREVNLSKTKKGITARACSELSTRLMKASKEVGIKLDIVKLRDCGIEDEMLYSLQQFMPIIVNLDLSYNPTIQPRGLSYMGDFLEMSCSSRLQSLSLTNCNLNIAHLKAMANLLPLLKEAIFDENRLFGTSEFEYLSSIVTSRTEINLESVSVKDCNICDEHLEAMTELILRMRTVDLSGNRSITSDGLEHLAKSVACSSCCCLERLVLKNYYIQRSNISALCELLILLKDVSLEENLYIEPQKLATMFHLLRKKNTLALQRFPLRNCVLTDDHMKEIASLVPYLTQLDLSNQSIMTPAGMTVLANVMLDTSSKQMKILTLSNSRITDEHIGELCNVFPLMKNIDLSCNRFLTRKGLGRIWKAISQHNQLAQLNLADINCNDSHMNEIAQLIPFVQSLNLSLDNNKTLTCKSLETLAGNVIRASLLESVSLKDCNLRENHLQAISKMVPNVENLDISNNKFITAKGLLYLSHSVCAADKNILKKFSLRNCNIKEKELEALSSMVPLLKVIDLSCNKTISPIGIRRFSAHLHSAESTKLETVILQECNLNHSHFDAMEMLMQKIEHLNISDNRNMTAKDLKQLSNITSSKCSTVQSIDISNCNLQDFHLKSISDILFHLQKLILNNNWSITHSGLENLSKVLSSSKISSMKVLQLADCNLNGKAIDTILPLVSSLTEIDLSKNKMISALHFANFEFLCNSKLEIIDFSDCGLTDEHLISLTSFLAMLKIIILNNNKQITYNGLKHVSDILEEKLVKNGYLKIKEVHLKDCGPHESWRKLSYWNTFFKINV